MAEKHFSVIYVAKSNIKFIGNGVTIQSRQLPLYTYITNIA